jgi:hypothetical protein
MIYTKIEQAEKYDVQISGLFQHHSAGSKIFLQNCPVSLWQGDYMTRG